MISVSHLTKYYGSLMAVDDLSFEIDEGHVYGFLGPNGAGKTTTMNIMTGCLSATAGSVQIDGYDIFEDPGEAKKRIGYLPEQPPLYLSESPEEYLRFVGEAKGLRGSALQEQIQDVIQQTGIEAVKGRRIAGLSKGYRQRVGIAQALLGNPKAIILDEPTVGLDPIQIIEIRELIKELGKQHTVIFSSHILSEVQTICDQVLIIANGKLVAFDRPEALEKRLLAPNEILVVPDGSTKEAMAILESLPNISDIQAETEGTYPALRVHGDAGDIYRLSRSIFLAFAQAKKPPTGAAAGKGQPRAGVLAAYRKRPGAAPPTGWGREAKGGEVHMIAVLKHELRLYFHSLTAYVFGAFLLAFVGIGAMLYNIQAAVSNFEFVLSFGSLVFVVIVPILTMRVIAEERKQKTDQLLYALPITTTQVILGKYLALLVVYLIPLALISLYPLVFSQFGEVYLPTSYGSILAFFVLGAALIALGVFISSLTDNQGFAAGIGIAAILLNYYSVSLSEYISSTAFGSLAALCVLVVLLAMLVKYLTKNETLAYFGAGGLLVLIMGFYMYDPTKFEGLLPQVMADLSLFERFYVFVNGVFDMTAIVYYLTAIVFFLFLAVQSLEKRRYN